MPISRSCSVEMLVCSISITSRLIFLRFLLVGRAVGGASSMSCLQLFLTPAYAPHARCIMQKRITFLQATVPYLCLGFLLWDAAASQASHCTDISPDGKPNLRASSERIHVAQKWISSLASTVHAKPRPFSRADAGHSDV